MPVFHLRPARPGDAAAVAALLDASYSALLAPDYDEAVLAAALPRMNRANPTLLACGTWYVAEDSSGALLGCGGWTPERPGSGEREPGLAHLRHFGTHPQATRRGVGRALVERTLAEARAAGFDRFECYSTRTAAPFYARFGFTAVEEIDVSMGPGVVFPSVLMRLERGRRVAGVGQG